ncbi:MAG: AraC family transcriptional regulator [Opitutus sp.]|nr:AraC family transcriptional regulator [Opitutus sp.]
MTRNIAALSRHRYLAESPESEPWGIAVTAAGRQLCAPGTAYPPPGHPEDHAFSWDNGRVLPACQVVFILDGRGRFESRATGLQEVTAGTALVILPNVWHRYAPDFATGWVEQWIELRGPVVESLLRRETLHPKRAVVRIERTLEFTSLFDAIQSRLTGDSALACDPERGALGLQVLALVAAANDCGPAARSITALIGRAERLLADSVEHAPPMPELARKLGVAYSYFRREFKRHTGLSPHRYLNQMRLEKARRLMGATDESLKAIADRLGFSSPYHFSAAFKRHFGVAPEHWRQRHQRSAAGA